MRLTRGNPTLAGTALIALVLVAVLAAVSINLSFGLPFNLSLGWPPGRDYTLRADFQDANNLVKGADVEVAGSRVGQVTDIEVRGGRAEVSMRIERQYAPIHRGTVASIRYSTLLAQKYVELTPAAGTAAIPSGGLIPSDETVTPVDFDQVLSSLDPQTRQQLQVLIQNLGGGVKGRQQAINDLLDQLSGLSQESRGGLTTLHTNDPQLDSIVVSLAVVGARLARSHRQLGDLVAQTALLMGVLVNNERDLDGAILHLAHLARDFDQTLNGEEGNLKATIQSLDPLLLQLNGTLATTYPYLQESMQSIQDSFNYLIPFIGSAIASSDANGNYLRQFVVLDTCNDQLRTTPTSPGESQAACLAPASTQQTTGSGASGPQAPPASNTGTGSAKPSPTPCTGATPPPANQQPCPNQPSPSPCQPSPGASPSPSPSCSTGVGLPLPPLPIPSLPLPSLPSLPGPLAMVLG